MTVDSDNATKDPGDQAGDDNGMVISRLLNNRINERMGIKAKQRATVPLEKLEAAVESLDEVRDLIRQEIEKLM